MAWPCSLTLTGWGRGCEFRAGIGPPGPPLGLGVRSRFLLASRAGGFRSDRGGAKSPELAPLSTVS